MLASRPRRRICNGRKIRAVSNRRPDDRRKHFLTARNGRQTLINDMTETQFIQTYRTLAYSGHEAANPANILRCGGAVQESPGEIDSRAAAVRRYHRVWVVHIQHRQPSLEKQRSLRSHGPSIVASHEARHLDAQKFIRRAEQIEILGERAVQLGRNISVAKTSAKSPFHGQQPRSPPPGRKVASTTGVQLRSPAWKHMVRC